MTEKQSAPPQYWIFKDSTENHFGPTDFSSSYKIWFIDPNPEVKPSDIVYFWKEEDSSYVYGWGAIESTRTELHGEAVASLRNWSEARFRIQLRYHLFQTNPLMGRELYEDPVLGSLSELREIQEQIIELTPAQAVALNRLIRTRDVQFPPDPPIPLPKQEEEEEEEEERGRHIPTDKTLDKSLETYSRQLSSLGNMILLQAKEFAAIREHNRNRLTTSCLLFGAIELGKSLSGREVENAAQFASSWMSKIRVSVYEKALAAFLGQLDAAPLQGPKTVSSHTVQVMETANRIATVVRKEPVISGPEVIYARDLLGALLFTMATKRLGAARRLADMDVNLETFRRDYFNEFLNHEKNPDDDIEKWRQIIIELRLDDKSKVVREIKTSLPSIDADTPSLKDQLNITAEVKGFANIIAARDVKTPLSIGLFGDWGSGKSTFMEQLQAEVERISLGVRNKQANEETSFLGNIVQIKFNAWHYAEANLWASLVSHVFDNLSFSEAEEKKKAEDRKQLILGKLVTTLTNQRVAEAEVKVKEANYEEAKTELEGANRAQDKARFEKIQWLTEGVWPLVLQLLRQNEPAQSAVTQARAVLGREGLTEEELRRELKASKTTLGQAQLHLKSVLNDPHRGLMIAIILVLTILVPMGIAFLVAWVSGNATLDRVITGVMPLITLLGGGFAWLRSKRPIVQGWLNTIDNAEHHLDAMYASANSRYKGELSRLTQEVAEKEAEIETAKQRVDLAKTEVAETVASLKEMEPARVLENFVQERAASTDYRKLLGVVALIRRDFKKLSDMLREQGNTELRQAVTDILKKDQQEKNEDTKTVRGTTNLDATALSVGNGESDVMAEPSEKSIDEALEEYRIDRIVLYIDDLDRCPPKQVVDVLQAIHLLLAFELFVVVVGVDARWIRHALQKRFPEMLSEDWDGGNGPSHNGERRVKRATPRDYVEKIFQVPFWLKPMDDEAAQKLLRGLIPESQLLRSAGADNGEAIRPDPVLDLKSQQPAEGSASDDFDPAAIPETGGRKTPDSQTQGASVNTANARTLSSSAGSGSVGEPDKEPELVLKPEGLLLDVRERDAMIALSRIIGTTPRTLKRFVNVYRIIKAGLDAARLEALMGTGPSDAQYVAVLMLLGVAHGAPDVASVFFRELKSKHDRTVAENGEDIGLKLFLNQVSTPADTLDESLKPAWERLIRELQTAATDASDIPLKVLRSWLPVVVRYTFQLGRLSEEVSNQTI